jgi:hypothetical protein
MEQICAKFLSSFAACVMLLFNRGKALLKRNIHSFCNVEMLVLLELAILWTPLDFEKGTIVEISPCRISKLQQTITRSNKI